MVYGQKCNNCGGGLTDEQIYMACADAGTVPMAPDIDEYDVESDEYDQMVFCCSTYDFDRGTCEGNDTHEAAYWAY